MSHVNWNKILGILNLFEKINIQDYYYSPMGKYILTKIWYFVFNKWIFEIIVFINKCSNCTHKYLRKKLFKKYYKCILYVSLLGFIKITIIIQNLINSKFILLQLLLQTIFVKYGLLRIFLWFTSQNLGFSI